jgi:integrase
MIRKGSRNPQFVQRIPTDLRDQMIGMRLNLPVGDAIVPIRITASTQAIRVSLKTADPTEAKNRQAGLAGYLERVFAALREERPIPLTHRQAVALSGEIYRAWAKDIDPSNSITLVNNDDGSVEISRGVNMEVLKAACADQIEKLDRLAKEDDPEVLEKMFGPLVNRLLFDKSIHRIDTLSRHMILKEFRRALRQALDMQHRKTEGDYSLDGQSERFPEWQAQHKDAPSGSVSLTGLVEAWWREARLAGNSESTHESYSKAFSTLADFLKHDDASRVTENDMLRFKDHLLTVTNPRTGKHLSTKTVKASYLSALRSVFYWAVDNRKLKTNPASNIPLKVGKRIRTRQSWFKPDEIKSILAAASKTIQRNREPWQRHAGRRWVPWLCAYSGARVGEIVQMRKEDVRKEGDVWVLTITPEAVTVKDKEAREVPLHPHLVEQGFVEFIRTAPDGPLFMWSGTGREAWRTAKNRLTEFIRTTVADPNVQPNHGWRHTFKTIGSEAGIQDKVLDAITGHEPRTVGEGYGGVTLAAKVRAIKRFPVFLPELPSAQQSGA